MKPNKSANPAFKDYEAFYYNNEPDNTGILLDLYNSVYDLEDVMFFKTEAIDRGAMKYLVTAACGDKLLLTERSRDAFLSFIQDKNPDPELDLEERAAYEYSLNNPHS